MADISDRLGFSSLQSKWGWFAALGVLLIVCGFIALANVALATVVSVYYVGILMLVGGVVYLIHAFQVRNWEQALVWALSGVLYLLAGFFAFENPLLASAVLTLFLAIALLVAGVFRIWVGWRMRPVKGWGWVLVSGIITALAGVVIALGWPVNSLWILGLFLACDLLLQGWSMLAFGLAVRR
ncbi:HdeD family acid-resistance protein [Rhizobium sp. 57MFTsu3.2]|uniref:HdeD family acid-resistance protein n=1 Tax=Rhizobium sp. 57MFTsu3.2 TaxID=1048681 RepID=UPI00146D0065|nr:HdeD family acid-resistance protein [Rhizobium sp. 57MFTsu3.2]NMN73732.1 uncharacterized membrane protein HdeD (DUF308 family) [Rhizobium sp. 57MFTsu3.2]